MWINLVVGAILGLVVGHFAPPGYALWVIIGLVAGYLVHLWQASQKENQEKKDQDQPKN